MAKVAINGLGRIGRAAFKLILDTPELDLVAVNDLVPTENLAYLLNYDTVYGRYKRQVKHDEQHLMVDGQRYRVFNEKDPSRLPWGDLGVDIVLECTGIFTKKEDLQKHVQAGARFVILSAPVKGGEEVETIVHSVNRRSQQAGQIISCASCTTNCITPVVEVMGRRIGVEKAILTTVHAYTASQPIVDAPSKRDFRAGRAGAINLIPASTGAAVATARALPQYEGKFDGVAVRAPVPVGSIADIVFVTSRPTTVEEVNTIFREEAEGSQYQGILGVSDDPLVSSDIIGDSRASIVDLALTLVVGGNLVKIMTWYDNEWGYTNQMIREAAQIAREAKGR
jgi:glyceraldehyde 3-phosphate dehydrogenase